jgi:hypothetical protein
MKQTRLIPKILFLFILQVFAVDVYAQESKSGITIRGKALENAKTPIVYASVSLLSLKDSTLIRGTLSDIDGSFIFNKVSKGTYIIAIESTGYRKSYSEIYKVDTNSNVLLLKDIYLKSDARQLDLVNISAKKALIERKNGNVTINVENSILAAGNSALEILSKAPGVSVDQEGNISLKGKRGVNVMIDNKLTYLSSTQLTELLRSTNGNSIKTIELIGNPSAKYDASGSGGIINIKLKKNTGFGTNGSVDLTGGHGRYHKLNTGINLNHRNKNLNIFGHYDYADSKDFENLSVIRSNKSGNEVTYFNNYGGDVNSRKNHNYKAGIDYYFNDNNVLGMVVTGYNRKGHSVNHSTTLIGSKPAVVDSLIQASNPLASKYSNQTYNLNFKSVMDTLGQELNIDIDYSRFNSNNQTVYNNYYYNTNGDLLKAPVIFRTMTPTKVDIWVGKIDYTYAITPKLKLETGLKSSIVQTDNDFSFENFSTDSWNNDVLKSNRFIYNENINAAYFNLNQEFKATTVQLGLRAEQTVSKGNSLTVQKLIKRNFLDFFPNVNVSQQLSRNQELGIAYSRRIDRPEYESLNPFLSYADIYTFSRGNPYLNPQYANSFDLNYSYKKTLNISVGYLHTKDVITSTLLTDTVNKTLILTDQNLASRTTYNFSANRPFMITKWWNTANDVTVYYSRFSSPNLMGMPFKNGKTTYSLNTVHTFQLSSSLSSELSFNYTSPQVFGTYIARPIYGTDFGFSKSFASKKANVKMAVSDIFNTNITMVSSAIANQNYQLAQKQESRVFRVTFTYNFGSSLIKAIRERSNGSDAEQGRVKSGN